MDEPVKLEHNGICPEVTLHGHEILDIPEEGLITFRFKRGQIIARSASKKEKASASVTLELTKLCSHEEAEAEASGEEEYRDSPIDKLFEKSKEDEPEAEEES